MRLPSTVSSCNCGACQYWTGTIGAARRRPSSVNHLLAYASNARDVVHPGLTEELAGRLVLRHKRLNIMPASTRMYRQRGFSVLELAVVLAIVGVITAIGLPRMRTMLDQYRLRAAVEQLAGQIDVAKLKATSQANPYQVQINTAKNTFQMNQMTSPPGTTPRTFGIATGLEPQPLPRRITYGFNNVSVAAGDTNEQTTGTSNAPVQSNVITFNSIGLPVDANGNPTQQNAFYVTSPQGRVMAVTVSMSGRILIWSWMGQNWIKR